MNYSLQEITTIVSGKLDPGPDLTISHVSTDSRNIQYGDKTMFIALETEKADGHQYLQDAYTKGVRVFLVSEIFQKLPEDVSFILVADTLVALQKLAAFHRNKFDIPVIAITGSNGKTIVKEWLSQLLSLKYFVVKSPKSYNSQIGVPLSVLEMNEHHEIAVFEAGISTYGEMTLLQEILKPSIGVFTNIGSAHAQGFKTTKDKAQEKALLFVNTPKVVFPQAQKHIVKVLKKGQSFAWGNEGFFHVSEKVIAEGNIDIVLTHLEDSYAFKLPFTDDSSFENALNAICTCLLMNVSVEDIQHGLNGFKPLAMRLQQKKGVNGVVLIDDTYNNDIQGLEVALSFLNQQGEGHQKSVILSDLQQTEENKKEVYKRVAELINGAKLKKFVGIGIDICEYKKYFGKEAVFFKSKEAFVKSADFHFSNEYLLVKGAREFALESLVKGLESVIHDTRLEIDLGAIIHNYNYYRSLLLPTTKMMVMVKALSYGSGTAEIARVLEYNHVAYLAVAYVEEGVKLRQQGIKTPIMVMNMAEEALAKMARYNLEPEIYSLKQLKKVVDFEADLGIHIKLDTGMRRLGFEQDESEELLNILREKRITVKSVFTHLAGADEAIHDTYTAQQFDLFDTYYDRIANVLGYTPIKHALNSSGIVRFTDYQYDMVRLGIGLYGVESSGEKQEKLLTVGELKTTISQVKTIKKGETVGYGRKGKVFKDTKIATLPIGYADGYDRRFSNGGGAMLVKGQKVPVIGNVCMDMTMIDVTGLEVEEGDEVLVFGKGNPVWEYAEKIGTISYELLTNISERVKRVFYMS